MHIRFIVALSLLLFTAGQSYAQPFTIKGSVSDTVNMNALQYASVTLMHAKDSVLETFTRTDANGVFNLHTTAKGKYVIMITFPGFVDYVDVIDLKENDLDLGAMPMVSRTHLLKEFVFTQQVAAIKVKGDTTEYVADSFKTRDGATVEALLKKLPGIQVDKNGKITAQGEQVQKILVDGEEFFSDDPAVVTKSLQAKTIDKVQVFDKKSDQAEFTGIDDGEKIKTINLQLKDANKKGYFGRVIAAGGPGEDQGYFENQAMINAFKGKRKLSAFGIMSNTGKVGLGWEDRDKYGSGGMTTEMTEDGGMMSYYTQDEDDFEGWNGRYNGEGFPKSWTGGVHYSNKWNEDKHHLSGNYRYGKQSTEVIGNTLTQYVLPGDSQFFQNQSKNTFTMGERNRGDGLYEWKIDSTSTLKLTANANYANTQSRSVYNTESFNETAEKFKNVLNQNTRTLSNDGTSLGINAKLDYRKKFKKKGRTISLSMNETFRQTDGKGYLSSINTVGGGNVDQHKVNATDAFSLASRISYTEPLSKVAFLELNYNLKLDNREAERYTYDRGVNPGDGYDSLNNLLSSHYAYDILINTGGANLRFVYDKITYSIGGAVSNSGFNQKDLFRDTAYRYNFVNFFPRANFTYRLNKQSRISFNYSGYTEQPSLEQIQPLANNNDPLNIVIGNPDLKQSFSHDFNINFNDYKVLTNRYVYASARFSFTDNDISRTETVDGIGRRLYQYTNIDGNYNGWAYFGYGFKIKKLNLQLGPRFNVSTNHVNSIVNGIKNVSDVNSYTAGFDFNYDPSESKISVRFTPGVTYNNNKSTISTLTPNYWTSDNEFEMSYELPFKIEIGTDINWSLRQRTAAFDRNNNVFRWNAYISKKFLKKDALELRASAFDILNQNIGYNRYAQNNYVTENSFNTIRRYGMISLAWNFTKSPAAPAGDSPMMIIK